MLTKDQLISVLAACDIPYDFLVFDVPQMPPYALILETDTRNISSDFETLEEIHDWEVELYYRTLEDREAFEQHLMDAHIVWERYGTDTYIDSESCYLSRYDL